MGGGALGTWKRLGSGELLAQDADEGLGHILPFKVYGWTLAILLFLTVVTVWVSQIDLGSMNAVVAILVASIKAGLVMCFFMHLKFEGKVIIAYVIYPLVLLVLLIGGTYSEIVDRQVVLPARQFSDDFHFKPVIPSNNHGEGSHETEHH